MPFAQYTRPDNVPLPKHSSPAPLTPGRSSTTSEREFCSPTTYRSHPAAPSSLAVVGFLLSSSAVLLLLAFLVTASSVTAVTTTPFYEQNKRIRATDVLLLSGIITLGQLPQFVVEFQNPYLSHSKKKSESSTELSLRYHNPSNFRKDDTHEDGCGSEATDIDRESDETIDEESMRRYNYPNYVTTSSFNPPSEITNGPLFLWCKNEDDLRAQNGDESKKKFLVRKPLSEAYAAVTKGEEEAQGT
ncbi:hypothetical protein V490_02931 [Pseudogymnoascus sp. VKM F-3557]|nr:hypothetical protein V490_02931 [Pseudogymnoascus sp. VKM F-3557]